MDTICIVLKKTIYRSLFCNCFLERNLPTEFLRYLLELLKVSIVPLKKRIVKQIQCYCASDCNWTRTQNHLVLKRTIKFRACFEQGVP